MEAVKKNRVAKKEALILFQDDIYTLAKRADETKKRCLEVVPIMPAS